MVRYALLCTLFFARAQCSDEGLTHSKPIESNGVVKMYWYDTDDRIEKIGFALKNNEENWYYYYQKTKTYGSSKPNTHTECCDEMMYHRLVDKYRGQEEHKRGFCLIL